MLLSALAFLSRRHPLLLDRPVSPKSVGNEKENSSGGVLREREASLALLDGDVGVADNGGGYQNRGARGETYD